MLNGIKELIKKIYKKHLKIIAEYRQQHSCNVLYSWGKEYGTAFLEV